MKLKTFFFLKILWKDFCRINKYSKFNAIKSLYWHSFYLLFFVTSYSNIVPTLVSSFFVSMVILRLYCTLRFRLYEQPNVFYLWNNLLHFYTEVVCIWLVHSFFLFVFCSLFVFKFFNKFMIAIQKAKKAAFVLYRAPRKMFRNSNKNDWVRRRQNKNQR